MASDNQTYFTSRQLRERYGVSDMSIWRWCKDERLQFPAPIKINTRRLWKRGEIERWERERARERINAA